MNSDEDFPDEAARRFVAGFGDDLLLPANPRLLQTPLGIVISSDVSKLDLDTVEKTLGAMRKQGITVVVFDDQKIEDSLEEAERLLSGTSSSVTPVQALISIKPSEPDRCPDVYSPQKRSRTRDRAMERKQRKISPARRRWT